MLMAIVFISQVASAFIVLPVGGFTLPFQQWSCLRLDAVPRRLELHERRKS
jgi:hypothetical protein